MKILNQKTQASILYRIEHSYFTGACFEVSFSEENTSVCVSIKCIDNPVFRFAIKTYGEGKYHVEYTPANVTSRRKFEELKEQHGITKKEMANIRTIIDELETDALSFPKKRFHRRIDVFPSAIRVAAVTLSGALKMLALDLNKIVNDLRLLASGPNTGLGEINLLPVEPGSSVMPGKINPSICEAANMACLQVVDNDTAVAMGCAAEKNSNDPTPCRHSIRRTADDLSRVPDEPGPRTVFAGKLRRIKMSATWQK